MLMADFFLGAVAIIPQPATVRIHDGFLPHGTPIVREYDSKIVSEGYDLDVNSAEGKIVIRCSDDAGEFYARKTLEQIGNGCGYPGVRIFDEPFYRWRGLMLDECRHFFGKEVVLRTLDLMAQHKLNVFHWHLTDDQGWRLEIPGYPELIKYGAVRKASPRIGARIKWLDSNLTLERYTMRLNDEQYGPYYYTEKDVREVVSYAAERHIKVIPEIELPGHAYAALAAYPSYACRPENLAHRSPRLYWGVEEDVMCAGNDDALKFMENVLDYVCRVFPSDIVHIGGDECPNVRWKSCPKCQLRVKTEGLKDATCLQGWITTRFTEFLAKRGKRALGWDEYLRGDVPADAIGMSWKSAMESPRSGRFSAMECLLREHELVMTPCSHCYLDYGQGLLDDPFQYIHGCIPLRIAHSFDPVAGIDENLRKGILGGQANCWSEYTWSRFDLDWKTWPRACALAEALWCGERKPEFEDFRRRMTVHRRRLISQGVNCAPLE